MARTPTNLASADADDTVKLPRYRRRRVRWRGAAGIAAAIVLLGGSVLWHFLRPARRDAPPLADQAALLAAPTGRTSLYRLRPSPAILVVLFASTHEQALALNRVGAFVEKAGAPHDRVLDDASLGRAIDASGAAFDDYYQGHDYRSADLRHFYAAADRDGVALDPAETALRARLDAAGVLASGAADAVISIPPAGPGQGIDAADRGVILTHEVSHGAFFTDPAYAGYVARFWDTVMTADDRARFTAYLQKEGYDPAIAELMRNECQAYLVFTPGDRYFNAAMLGMPPAHMAELRRAFIDGMPPNWLKASLGQ